MKAVVIHEYGGVDRLKLSEIPSPSPGPGEVLIRIEAAAVNPADHKWRQGMFAVSAPLTFPHILGMDVAGRVEGGAGFPVGTRVAAKLFKNGYAEYIAVPAALVARVPDNIDLKTASAVATGGLTGLQIVERAVGVQAGELILLTGALGSVGRFALHAARQRGAHVIAAVRSTQLDEALAIGADEVLALGETDWSGAPFDHMIDTVGGPDVARLCRNLKPGGRIVTAATTPIEGDDLPAPVTFYAVQPDGADLARLLDDVAAGKLDVPIGPVLPLSEVAQAHRLMEIGGAGGKIILLP